MLYDVFDAHDLLAFCLALSFLLAIGGVLLPAVGCSLLSSLLVGKLVTAALPARLLLLRVCLVLPVVLLFSVLLAGVVALLLVVGILWLALAVASLLLAFAALFALFFFWLPGMVGLAIGMLPLVVSTLSTIALLGVFVSVLVAVVASAVFCARLLTACGGIFWAFAASFRQWVLCDFLFK